jgi:hypothetical protein
MYPKDFIVNIKLLTTAVGQKGFGTILVLDHESDHVYTQYTSIDQVSDDFEVTTSAYEIASTLFAQGVSEVAIAGKLTTDESELVAELNLISEKPFFGVACTLNTDASIADISAWVDTQERVYAVTTDNKAITGTSNQTIIGYHENDYMAEALLAYMVTAEIGSATAKFKQLAGITASEITVTEYNTLIDNNVMVYVKKLSVPQTANSKMIGGEYIDVVLGKLWINIRMEEDLAQLALTTPKIPYTNQGISLLVDVATKRLKLAARQDIIALDDAGNPLFEVTVLPVSEVPTSDKANRKYDYIRWTAVLAGAIEEGEISGFLTLE